MQTANVTISPVNMADRIKIDIKSGDTVRVWQKVEEKGKTRLQPFEGLVLARKHGNEPGATFTVRRTGDAYGVEKIYPLYSPNIDKIEILRRSKVRRSKLYHIREKAAREIKRQMRNMMFVDIATGSDTEEKAQAVTDAEDAKKAEEEKTQTPEQPIVEEKEAESPKTEKAEATQETTQDPKASDDARKGDSQAESDEHTEEKKAE